MATMSEDPVLGTLTWDTLDRVWAGSVEVPFFRDFGDDLPQLPRRDEDDDDDVEGIMATVNEALRRGREALAEMRGVAAPVTPVADVDDDDDAPDPDTLFAQGRFKITLSGLRTRPPSQVQRDSWKQLTKGGKTIFDQLMKRLLDVYRRQRPTRIRWWNATWDDPPDEALPDARTARDLKKLLRPLEFRVHSAGDIGIHIDASWDRGGLGVRVRGGEIASIGDRDVALAIAGSGKTIDHPVLGILTRDDDQWEGSLRFEPFHEFCAVAHLQHFFNDGERRSAPAWSFIEGDFGLTVNDEDCKGPSAAQVAARQAFMRNPNRVARETLDAIVQYYRKLSKTYRKDLGSAADALMPKIESADALERLISFLGLTIFEKEKSRGREKPIAIALTFSCTWDEEHGLAVRWRDGKIEAVGQLDEAIQ
jgi:hypothetical protein